MRPLRPLSPRNGWFAVALVDPPTCFGFKDTKKTANGGCNCQETRPLAVKGVFAERLSDSYYTVFGPLQAVFAHYNGRFNRLSKQIRTTNEGDGGTLGAQDTVAPAFLRVQILLNRLLFALLSPAGVGDPKGCGARSHGFFSSST
jgi:hypothetical protein